MSPVPALIRTAFDLQVALDNVDLYLRPIGTCPSKTAEWRRKYVEDHGRWEEEEAGEEVEAEIMEKLQKLQHNYMATVAFGYQSLPLSLTITRTGCEYEGIIGASEREVDTNERLRKWYEVGALSGYGDVKTQETEVDSNMCSVREIPASEFHVSPDSVALVEENWSNSLFPMHVRVEPYKIYIYGPGGKFKHQRDSAETDLVGMFLVGLGNTRAAFEIERKAGEPFRHDMAYPGRWVAFYPDNHSVITSGYLAVLAFKIFRQHLDTPAVSADVELCRTIKDTLTFLQQPYGILLRHQYSAGTAALSGLDAVLYAAAAQTGGDVKLLPVLIQWTASRAVDINGFIRGGSESSAEVFPMTKMHVDAVLDHIRVGENDEDDEEESQSEMLFVDLKGTDAEWIEYHTTTAIPFYSPCFGQTAITWRQDIQEADDYASRPREENISYLSYALVVLPVQRASEEPDAA
ncbi:hypothetical protein K438DRAFT_1953548 [Mycena galopus ATCC 62051]|nr:hypothetical protein K438DRAFT_1953548 [Mycena galopus ATCC 62051]